MQTGKEEQDERIKAYDLWRYKLAQRDALRALKDRDEAQQRLDNANARQIAFRAVIAQHGINLPDGSSTDPYTDISETDPTGLSDDSAFHERMKRDVAEVEDLIFTNKTDFVRRVISRAGSIGATPGEIKEAAIKAGVEVNPGYPYSVIQKLKLRGVIKETSSGRYTLVKTKKRQ